MVGGLSDDIELGEFGEEDFLSGVSEIDGNLQVLSPTLHFHHISYAKALVLYDTSLTESIRRW